MKVELPPLKKRRPWFGTRIGTCTICVDESEPFPVAGIGIMLEAGLSSAVISGGLIVYYPFRLVAKARAR
jgi:hypothetical protein